MQPKSTDRAGMREAIIDLGRRERETLHRLREAAEARTTGEVAGPGVVDLRDGAPVRS